MNAGPPAPDTVASVPQAAAVARSGANLMQRNQHQLQFLQHWSDQLRAAKKIIMEQEDITAAEWQRLAQGLKA